VSALNLFLDLSHRISSASGDDREDLFLFQRLSVALQSFNGILSHQRFVESRKPDLIPVSFVFSCFNSDCRYP